jgi:hypothetical protein
MGALVLAGAIVVILIALELWRPWRLEMGTDVDGNHPAASSGDTRLRAQPAE